MDFERSLSTDFPCFFINLKFMYKTGSTKKFSAALPLLTQMIVFEEMFCFSICRGLRPHRTIYLHSVHPMTLSLLDPMILQSLVNLTPTHLRMQTIPVKQVSSIVPSMVQPDHWGRGKTHLTRNWSVVGLNPI